LVLRSVIKVFSYNAQIMVPVSGIDIVKIIMQWYEEINVKTDPKGLRAF
jgi:hypothetical protein